jgi:hypothetical protein
MTAIRKPKVDGPNSLCPTTLLRLPVGPSPILFYFYFGMTYALLIVFEMKTFYSRIRLYVFTCNKYILWITGNIYKAKSEKHEVIFQ